MVWQLGHELKTNNGTCKTIKYTKMVFHHQLSNRKGMHNTDSDVKTIKIKNCERDSRYLYDIPTTLYREDIFATNNTY